jgi:hypothetical protein
MPRRVYTYPADAGWGTLNLLASAGGVLVTLAVLLFLIDAVRALRHGMRATDDPWHAGSLEWATSSPPPPYNFLYVPTVAGREPLWDNAPDQPVVTGLAAHRREYLVTYVMNAGPDHRSVSPDPSIWPFVTALVTTALFIGSIFTPWAVVYGASPLFVALTGWFWPKRADEAGTPRWPTTRSLPKPNEAMAPGVAS